MKAAWDFSSSLYLAFHHASDELAPWRKLTLGVPAAVGRWSAVAGLERSLAELMGVESVLVGRSTLHMLWDIATCWQGRRTTVIIDEHAYPILSWCMSSLAGTGGAVQHLGHHDEAGLLRLCRSSRQAGRHPLVVTDSYCCVCGRAPRLKEYVEIVRRSGGTLLVDDTQGLGIFGEDPSRRAPWGTGGGGSLRWQGVESADVVVVVASLAKAFGAPLALVGGSDAMVRLLRQFGNSLWHCSQPTHVDIQAGKRALFMNRQSGDERRQKLTMLTQVFQDECRRYGLDCAESWHPSQAILGPGKLEVVNVVARLAARGITSLAGRDHANHPRLLFQLNAGHRRLEIRHVVGQVAALMHGEERRACSSSDHTVRGRLRGNHVDA